MPSLDIVIVNWNAGPLLRQCLSSVFASDLGPVQLSRVVVVDNASTDGSLDDLPFATPPFTPIRLAGNLGFGAACNIGAAPSTADYLLFLNPDTVLDADSLKGAVAFMEEPANATVGASTIRLRDENGVTQRCCARFPTVGRMLAQSVGLDRLLPDVFPPHFLAEWDHQDTRAVPQVMGAFLLIRRSLFARLSGFDERFFVYYEDVDLCRRIAEEGLTCMHNHAVSAVHVGCGTTNRIKARRQFYSARSRIQYARKYFGWPGALALTLDGLLIAPFARVAKGVAGGSLATIRDAVDGAAMLAGDLPNILAIRHWPLSRAKAGEGGAHRASGGTVRGNLMAGHEPAQTSAVDTISDDNFSLTLPPSGPLPLPLSRGRGDARGSHEKTTILALTRYPRQGASSRTRFLAYLPALAAAGVEVTVSPFFDETYLPNLYRGAKPKPSVILGCYWQRLRTLMRARSFDALWVEKELLPWVPFGLEHLLMQGRPFVVDFDDAWFHRYSDHRLTPVRALLGTKFERLVQRARLVVVGNDTLAAWARQAGARTILQQPTPVSLAAYRPVDAVQDQGPLRIGWIGTPTTAQAYLEPLLPVLAELIGSGRATLSVVGADGKAFRDAGATVLPWDEAREVEQLHSFDVGIMPLTDDPWSRGKCAYKLLQYMAVGLPVVASPVGMNAEVVRPGINGFLADSPEAWRTALTTLAGDPALRRRMGEAGRARVADDYSLEAVTPRLVAALREAAKG